MAKNQKTEPKEFESLVNQKVGTNKDGSPKLVFKIGKPITLSFAQSKYYKQIKYIK